jgi:hypothetical protein
VVDNIAVKGVRLAVLIACIAVPTASLSKDKWKQRTFDAPAKVVYQAAEKVIGLHHRIDGREEKNRIIRFHVGTTTWSWGYQMGLVVDPTGENSCKVSVSVKKSGGSMFSWGSGKKEVRKIFRWMEEELARSRADE